MYVYVPSVNNKPDVFIWSRLCNIFLKRAIISKHFLKLHNNIFRIQSTTVIWFTCRLTSVINFLFWLYFHQNFLSPNLCISISRISIFCTSSEHEKLISKVCNAFFAQRLHKEKLSINGKPTPSSDRSEATVFARARHRGSEKVGLCNILCCHCFAVDKWRSEVHRNDWKKPCISSGLQGWLLTTLINFSSGEKTEVRCDLRLRSGFKNFDTSQTRFLHRWNR